jgi:uncharacterized membrane protein YagU involved in acid resistance
LPDSAVLSPFHCLLRNFYLYSTSAVHRQLREAHASTTVVEHIVLLIVHCIVHCIVPIFQCYYRRVRVVHDVIFGTIHTLLCGRHSAQTQMTFPSLKFVGALSSSIFTRGTGGFINRPYLRIYFSSTLI